MTKHISIAKVWFDDDVTEFSITTSNGSSTVSVNVYTSEDNLRSVITDLEIFRKQVHGGLYDLTFGKFGPEYANGAYQARLHFYPPGRGQLCITVDSEADWYDFGTGQVTDRATLHLKTEPGLLDAFIRQLHGLAEGKRQDAVLECV